MAEIILGGKRAAGRKAVVNDDIAEIVRRHAWSLDPKGYPRTNLPASEGSPRRTMHMHHLVYVALYGFGPAPGEMIDHIDRDPLNNLDSNLRRVSRGMNNANGKVRSDNTSGFRGVYSKKNGHGAKRRWAAVVVKDGSALRLGSFHTKEEAARAVNAAFRLHFPGVPVPNPDADPTPDGAEKLRRMALPLA